MNLHEFQLDSFPNLSHPDVSIHLKALKTSPMLKYFYFWALWPSVALCLFFHYGASNFIHKKSDMSKSRKRAREKSRETVALPQWFVRGAWTCFLSRLHSDTCSSVSPSSADYFCSAACLFDNSWICSGAAYLVAIEDSNRLWMVSASIAHCSKCSHGSECKITTENHWNL